MTLTLVIGLAGGVSFVSVDTKGATKKIAINTKNFPDVNFRKALLGNEESDENKNIPASLEELYLSGVKNFKGIELFTNIDELGIENTKADTVKISTKASVGEIYFKKCTIKNLEVSGIKDTSSFAVNKGCNVTNLILDNFDDSEVDVDDGEIYTKKTTIKNFTKTTDISFESNFSWTQSLEVNNCPKLKGLYCESCEDDTNSALSSVKIEKCPLIEKLNLDFNNLSNIDLTKLTKLKVLSMTGNKFLKFDTTKFSKLEELDLGENPLTSLALNNNIKSLNIYSTKLKSFDISKYKELVYYECSENDWGSVDISKNSKLTNFYCSGNSLKTLDLTKNPKLEYLNCDNNQLTTLNIKNNPLISSVRCEKNKLKALIYCKTRCILNS